MEEFSLADCGVVSGGLIRGSNVRQLSVGAAGRAIQGCINGGMAAAGVADSGNKVAGNVAGCLAGASAALAGAGPTAQTAAGAAAAVASNEAAKADNEGGY